MKKYLLLALVLFVVFITMDLFLSGSADLAANAVQTLLTLAIVALFGRKKRNRNE